MPGADVGATCFAWVMDFAALLVAALSLVLAGLSLGWQIAQWLMSGARAKASLCHGLLDHGGAYVGDVGTDGRPKNLRPLVAQGLGREEVLAVRVTNHGRAPVTVTKYWAELKQGTLAFSP